jgi:hypothetical protein
MGVKGATAVAVLVAWTPAAWGVARGRQASLVGGCLLRSLLVRQDGGAESWVPGEPTHARLSSPGGLACMCIVGVAHAPLLPPTAAPYCNSL